MFTTFIIAYISIGIIFNTYVLIKRKSNDELIEKLKKIYVENGWEYTSTTVTIWFIFDNIFTVLFWPFKVKFVF